MKDYSEFSYQVHKDEKAEKQKIKEDFEKGLLNHLSRIYDSLEEFKNEIAGIRKNDNKEEKEKVETLEEKSKNPVDYEITAKIYPFDDDIENSIQSLEKRINDAQKELDDINIKLYEKRPIYNKTYSINCLISNIKK